MMSMRPSSTASTTTCSSPAHTVISNASCTTNCLAPLAKVLNDAIGITAGVMTTIHSYTNDQVLTDVYHSDLRRARSATHSMIPTKTGAAAAVGLVLPELKGKLDGFAIRVPTINVSLVDLSFHRQACDQRRGDQCADEGRGRGPAARASSPTPRSRWCRWTTTTIRIPRSYDATMTKVIGGTLVKVCAWYDNEWGFSNRMLDTTLAWSRAA